MTNKNSYADTNIFLFCFLTVSIKLTRDKKRKKYLIQIEPKFFEKKENANIVHTN